jgi:hypothetical protein
MRASLLGPEFFDAESHLRSHSVRRRFALPPTARQRSTASSRSGASRARSAASVSIPHHDRPSSPRSLRCSSRLPSTAATSDRLAGTRVLDAELDVGGAHEAFLVSGALRDPDLASGLGNAVAALAAQLKHGDAVDQRARCIS